MTPAGIRDEDWQPGAPRAPGWYYCERGYHPATFVEVREGGVLFAGTGRVITPASISRHVDLPDFDAQRRANLRADAAEQALAQIGAWTHRAGGALKPPGPDTFGEGVRESQAVVRAILNQVVR